MKYWVYESWPHNKAIVHRADCLFCQNGTNRQGTASVRNGTWHGPFKKREEAFARAEKSQRKIRRGCQSCAP